MYLICMKKSAITSGTTQYYLEGIEKLKDRWTRCIEFLITDFCQKMNSHSFYHVNIKHASTMRLCDCADIYLFI